MKLYLSRILLLLLVASSLMISSCGKLNVFSLEDDKALGLQVNEQIQSDPRNFPVMAERGNEEIYRYVRGITRSILNSGKVEHRDEFNWTVYIIDDDETLNAFATPGGYMYVYTGLIKFLDSEDQLAGVMGHEIAHADQRHSTRQMTKLYGISTLLSIATGNAQPGQLEQIVTGLIQLKFSRSHETEADSYSVKYLCGTNYNASGAAGFFKKMEGQARQPVFLSTHPSPPERVEKIESEAREMNCRGRNFNRDKYNQIKKLI